MDFLSLDLPEPVLQGIREAGFVTTTPIQEAALPLALRGKDVAGQSQTGTGKTAAFLIAAFTRILRHGGPAPQPAPSPRVLIIAPTRELDDQLARGGDDQDAGRRRRLRRGASVAQDARERGDQERGGLAGPGLRLPRDVLASEGERQRGFLNGGGGDEPG